MQIFVFSAVFWCGRMSYNKPRLHGKYFQGLIHFWDSDSPRGPVRIMGRFQFEKIALDISCITDEAKYCAYVLPLWGTMLIHIWLHLKHQMWMSLCADVCLCVRYRVPYTALCFFPSRLSSLLFQKHRHTVEDVDMSGRWFSSLCSLCCTVTAQVLCLYI